MIEEERDKLKKIITAFITATLIFGPIGTYIFHDQPTTVDARGYKSGIKGFNFNNKNNPSHFQNKKQNSYQNNRSYANPNKKNRFMSGGLMKGLMLGGLAGLLFGGLLGHLGIFGAMMGFIINILALIVLIAIISKIVSLFKRKKREDTNPWRS